jgi:hypothetical protein
LVAASSIKPRLRLSKKHPEAPAGRGRRTAAEAKPARLKSAAMATASTSAPRG